MDLDNASAPAVSRGWRFTIPGTFVVDCPAERLDGTTLTVVFPRGLSPGQHDLTVTSPAGEFGGLEDALTVVAGSASGGGSGGATAAAGAAGAGALTATVAGSAVVTQPDLAEIGIQPPLRRLRPEAQPEGLRTAPGNSDP